MWVVGFFSFQRSYLIFNSAFIKPLLCNLNKLPPKLEKAVLSQKHTCIKGGIYNKYEAVTPFSFYILF